MKDESVISLVKEIKKEFGISLRDTFLDEIDVPEPILRYMVSTSMNWHNPDYDCWAIGKKLQRLVKDKIPLKTELEVSAGLWYLINIGKV
jgi:hypothetical protein